MAEEQVGKVVKFFAKPQVAAIEVTKGEIKKGDTIRIVGHTTDFTMEITSMEIDNQKVERASLGQFVGIKVPERVREGDEVFRISD